MVYLAHLFVVIPATLTFKLHGYSPTWILALYGAALAASALLGAAVSSVYSKPLTALLRGRQTIPGPMPSMAKRSTNAG